MRITGVNIDKITDDINIKGHIANCMITIDHDFRIRGIKLMNGSKGYYLQFPTDDYNMGLVFPIKDDFRVEILNRIVSKLER